MILQGDIIYDPRACFSNIRGRSSVAVSSPRFMILSCPNKVRVGVTRVSRQSQSFAVAKHTRSRKSSLARDRTSTRKQDRTRAGSVGGGSFFFPHRRGVSRIKERGVFFRKRVAMFVYVDQTVNVDKSRLVLKFRSNQVFFRETMAHPVFSEFSKF